MNNKNTTVETGKRTYKFVSSVVLLLAVTALFAVMWYMRLTMLMSQRFLSIGNYFMIGLYLVIAMLFINTFKGFSIGSQRISILVMSQTIALGLANCMELVIIVLMTRIKQFVWMTMGYIIVLTVAQAVAAQEIWQDNKYGSDLIVRIMRELEGSI